MKGSISRARGVSFPKHSFTRHSCVWVIYLIHTAQSNGRIFGFSNEETRSYVDTPVVSLRLIIIINWSINHIVVWTIVSNKKEMYYMTSDNVFSDWLTSLVTFFDKTLYSSRKKSREVNIIFQSSSRHLKIA